MLVFNLPPAEKSLCLQFFRHDYFNQEEAAAVKEWYDKNPQNFRMGLFYLLGLWSMIFFLYCYDIGMCKVDLECHYPTQSAII